MIKIIQSLRYGTFVALVALVSGCAGAAAASVFSLWAPFSALSDESLKTHSICEPAKENLKKEIKEEIIKEFNETPAETQERERLEVDKPRNPSLDKHDVIHSP